MAEPPGKVLIVGEDAAATNSFVQAFAGKGYTVETAADGEDALWRLDNDTYDAVFTDLPLRGVSGLEVAEELHARQPLLPVVIITESDPKAIQERAAAADVAGLFRKPLTPQQVADVVAQVSEAAQAAAALRPKAAPVRVERASLLTMFSLRFRNVVLFLLAPVLGLIYISLFPVISLGAFIWLGARAVGEKRRISQAARAIPAEASPQRPAAAKPSIPKTLVAMLGVVLLGLAYGIVGPILGVGVVLWFAFEAWGKLGAKAMKVSET